MSLRGAERGFILGVKLSLIYAEIGHIPAPLTYRFSPQVHTNVCTDHEKGFTKCEKGVLSMFLENLASASGVLSAL